MVLTITDPKGKRLETLDGQETMRHHFSAWFAGNYQFCVQNLSAKNEVEFTFSI